VTTSAIRLVIACAVVLAGAATTTACFRPRLPLPARPATTTPAYGIPTFTLQARTFTLTVDVSPAKVGTNIVHMYAKTPDGREASILEWRVTVANPAGGAQPTTAAVLPITPEHAVAELELLSAGVWRFSFTLRSKADEEVVSADVRIT